MSMKGLTTSAEKLDGSGLRVLIVHARWNSGIIQPLVEGARAELEKNGVKKSNIVVEDVSGSFELPLAASRLIAASQVQASANASDLLGSQTLAEGDSTSADKGGKGPFNAVIAIGVLIKGSTHHYEYICDAVSHGLMRVQLDTGVPVIFGILTCPTEDLAKLRAGIQVGQDKGHNHGQDWGSAAVEQALKTKRWSEGGI